MNTHLAQEEMARLGADNSPPEPPLQPAVPAAAAPPLGAAAVGTRVGVYSGATSRWCSGLVLAHRVGLHQVLPGASTLPSLGPRSRPYTARTHPTSPGAERCSARGSA